MLASGQDGLCLFPNWTLSGIVPSHSPQPEIHLRMTDLLFLGIDGGGTKCRARLRNAQGDLLGEGTGGPSNIRLDPELVWNQASAVNTFGAAVADCVAAVACADPLKE